MKGAPVDVLVVDDEEQTAVAICDALSHSGDHETRYVLGVADALLAIALRVPDVLITDLVMAPLLGDYLLERVKTEHPEVRRILCTSSVDDDLAEVLVELQLAHAVVGKTSDFGELTSALQWLSDGRRPVPRALEGAVAVRAGSRS